MDQNTKTGAMAILGAVTMLGMGYAAVPLYDLFCRVTGFGGTTQVATKAQAARAEALGETWKRINAISKQIGEHNAHFVTDCVNRISVESYVRGFSKLI